MIRVDLEARTIRASIRDLAAPPDDDVNDDGAGPADDFVNENVGWFGTNSSIIYKTVDGGDTWTSYPTPSKNSLPRPWPPARAPMPETPA